MPTWVSSFAYPLYVPRRPKSCHWLVLIQARNDPRCFFKLDTLRCRNLSLIKQRNQKWARSIGFPDHCSCAYNPCSTGPGVRSSVQYAQVVLGPARWCWRLSEFLF